MRLFLFALAMVAASSSAFAQISVLSSLSEDRHVHSDTSYSGEVLIKNTSGGPQHVRLYQRDYAFSADGRNDFAAPGSSDRSNAAWITFGPSSLVIPEGGTGRVGYRVDVPDSVEGSYWSILMVEAITPPDEEKPSAGIRAETQIRYGVQIATHVGASVMPNMEFTQVQLRGEDASRTSLDVDVANSGAQMARPMAWLEVFDENGTRISKLDGARYRIYPGTSVRYSYDLSSLEPATYHVMVVVDEGGSQIYGAQYTIEL